MEPCKVPLKVSNAALTEEKLSHLAPAFVAVIIYCDKTPKVMTVPQWKAINTSNWEYQASSDLKIRIIVKSDDRMKPDALVGSCVEAQSQNTDMDIIAATRNGLLTLGLIIRHKDTTDPVEPANPLAGTSPWAVLVAHSFAHSKVLGFSSVSVALIQAFSPWPFS